MHGFGLSKKAIAPLSLILSLSTLACGSPEDTFGSPIDTEADGLIGNPADLTRIAEAVHASQTTVFSRSTGQPKFCSASCTGSFCQDEARLAEALVDLTNAQRTQDGLAALGTNVCVTQLAKDHSATQARLRQAGGTLLGRDLSGRMLDADIAATISAENLHYSWATGQAFDDVAYPQRTMGEWMAAPVSSNRMLNPAFTVVGIGVVKALEGDRAVYYTTQVLMSP